MAERKADAKEPETTSGTSSKTPEASPGRQASIRTPAGTQASDEFALEDAYPEAHQVFTPSGVKDVKHGDASIVLDTNTLLVPYGIKPDDLTALEAIYKALADAGRLFIPARVAREFIKNRDTKLSELVKALNDRKSRLQLPEKRLSPLLEGVPGHDELLAAQEQLVESRKIYESHLTSMIEIIISWRGDDPVTSLYRQVFTKKNIIENSEDRKYLSDQWSTRLKNKIPPGYKDASKDDLGIGDFLIWKTILKIGSETKRDLVFVTGEEKSDWFVRSNRDGIYPRPELIDEYRRSSGGRAICLLSLSEFLQEMKAGEKLVEEIRTAEEESSAFDPDLDNSTSTSDNISLIDISDIRDLTKSIFPGRKLSNRKSLIQFAREIQMCGVSGISELKEILETYKSAAHSSEMKLYGEQYFTDLGIARECMRCLFPRYNEYIEASTDITSN